MFVLQYCLIGNSVNYSLQFKQKSEDVVWKEVDQVMELGVDATRYGQ